MKSLLFCFTFCCFAVALKANPPVYPQLSTVIDELHDHYNVPASSNERMLHFAKKPVGWMLQWTDQTQSPVRVIEEELFWSADSRKYAKLTLPAGKTVKSAEEKHKLFPYSDRYSFSRISYFGYIGWERDVINEFGGKAALNDTLLESLSRAYSSFAYSFTDNHYPYATAADKLDKKTKLDSFIYYSRLDISTVDRLRKQNPNYEMLAGNAENKYACNVMAFFDVLQYSGNENSASSYFKEELFTPVILANAKTALSECAAHGILFTNGDNDTYPLEYLQFVKGFRTDVTVINLSLLNLYQTIEQASKGRGKARPVKFSWPLEQYASSASDYFTKEDGSKSGTTYSSFLSNCILQKSSTGYGDFYSFPENTIEFYADTIFFPEMVNPSYTITPRIRMTQAYLLRSDFAQLDIIMSNLDERPIYYTITASDEGLNVENYLFSEGMVKRFIPFITQEGNEKAFGGQNILPGICYDNLMKIDRHAYRPVDKVTDERFVTNFRIQFIVLANELVSDAPAKSMQLLDRCDSLFPPAVWKYEPVFVYSIQTYYDAGQFEKGDFVALQMLDQFEKFPPPKNPESYEADLQMTFTATELIKTCAEKYNRSAVLEKANKYLEKKPAE